MAARSSGTTKAHGKDEKAGADDVPENTPERDDDTAAKSTSTDGDDQDKPNGTAYLNTTNVPLVYDKEGHQVDAADWTPPINLDAVGRDARKAGHLLPASAL